MDPEAALLQAQRALAREDPDEAIEFLKAYWGWREKGGFEPPNGDKRAEKIGKDIWAGTDEALQVEDIVNVLTEGSTFHRVTQSLLTHSTIGKFIAACYVLARKDGDSQVAGACEKALVKMHGDEWEGAVDDISGVAEADEIVRRSAKTLLMRAAQIVSSILITFVWKYAKEMWQSRGAIAGSLDDFSI